MPSREHYQEPPITAKQCQSPPSTAKQYQSPSSTAAHRCALLNTAEAHVDHRPKHQCWLRPCRSLQASQSTAIAEYRVTFHSIRRPPRRQSRGAHHYLAQRPWCCLRIRHCAVPAYTSTQRVQCSPRHRDRSHHRARTLKREGMSSSWMRPSLAGGTRGTKGGRVGTVAMC